LPGSFRSGGEIRPVQSLQKISAESDNPDPKFGGHSKRASTVARYEAQKQDAQELLYAQEIMTAPVFSLAPDVSIREATRRFTEQRYRHIPIMTPREGLVGLISDRDLLRFRAAHGTSRDDEVVSKVMVREVLIATPDTLIRDIARTMIEERIGSLPILDYEDTMVGIITRSDIVRALITHGPMRLWA
jgi:CBS domain-containing protein